MSGLGRKYLPLERYLRAQSADRVGLTFAEVEAVIGAPLPVSAWRASRWWANAPDAGPHARAWLTAGWRATNVNRPLGRVTFGRQEVQG